MSDRVDSFRLAAAYRAALELRLVSPPAVIAWADSAIERGGAIPSAVYQVSLAPTNAGALQDALGELSSTPVSELESRIVARALLDTVWQDVRARRRSVDEAMAMLHATRWRIALPHDLWLELVALDEDYALASDGIVGDLPSMEGPVRTWLAQFDGARTALLDGAA